MEEGGLWGSMGQRGARAHGGVRGKGAAEVGSKEASGLLTLNVAPGSLGLLSPRLPFSADGDDLGGSCPLLKN